MKKIVRLLIGLTVIIGLAGCGASGEEEKKEITLGATVPYSDMLEKGVKPYLEKKGYKVQVKEFNDYVQPNISLKSGSLDANLFQHKVYMDAFSKENDMKLASVVTVPTAPIGIYSNKYKSLNEIKPGSTVALANDPTNLARGLTVLRDNGLIEIDSKANPLRVSEKDVIKNPKKLKFQPVEAAQTPRTLDSVDLAAVNGNFAISSGLNLEDALVKDKLPDEIINRIVVLEEDKNSKLAKDLKDAVESEEFLKVINSDFKPFHKPEWMNKETASK
ncbi:MetQ/NlpA family ABC transporter substrate-binding protein [Fictibacillus phosphorivorans]|uniref:MetQ/NlpA family ABC transporter substrate-binding protein n=1 Tax=Fictibacillus phosphorivorans TaxID=1221500 RepID=UPI0020416914|nr:MetQ/NlpA family ABC transporter substrate-binding protein [Fictibacillus phosphorivorans]MCM3719554.1 MetQ/NlpA family ABC transporter substrate-binding protein [Fictibacillus phosphorivorans]MCM3777245.1 MetQ/NlpA family ABC transporter substrate-binding protein [Fictibacillus phosphorivorans]